MSVIIAGGGMAGATLALALSRFTHGALPVHLVEASAPESAAHPGFDARAIALADAPVVSWRALASGRRSRPVRRLSPPFTSATAATPAL